MSYSSVKPTPPKTCWAIAVTSRKVLHANSFAIGASRSIDRPFARAHAASCTRISPPSTAVDGVGEVVRDRLERAERLVELLAVLGVLHRDVERVRARRRWPARRAARCRRACVVVPRRPPGPGRADAVGRGHVHAGERHLVLGVGRDRRSAGCSATPAAAGSTRNRSTSVSAVAGPGQHDEPRWPRLANGTCHFIAVEHEAVAVGRRRGLDAARAEAVVRARATRS